MRRTISAISTTNHKTNSLKTDGKEVTPSFPKAKAELEQGAPS